MIVFWQNIPSIIQAPIISELSKITDQPVLVVAERDVSSERREQGWQMPEFGGAKLVISPSRAERLRLLRQAGDAATHVFTGIHAYPETYWTFRRAVSSVATVGIYSEPVDDRGWRGFLKRGLYKAHALRWAKEIEFLLLTGQRARDWFGARGFGQEKIFPYGYFVAWPSVKPKSFRVGYGLTPVRFELIFLGQLIPRKGLDLLLYALASVPEALWRLQVIGVGSSEGDYKRLANELGIYDQVKWVGAVPNSEVQQFLLTADAMILPSRFDGWGAVVNESLSVGTPVLVSDACGAAELVVESERGEVFKADSVPALTAVLRKQLAKGRVDSTRRAAIQDWAAASIAPTVAAEYLLGVMEHVRNGTARPDPPWLGSSPTGDNWL